MEDKNMYVKMALLIAATAIGAIFLSPILFPDPDLLAVSTTESDGEYGYTIYSRPNLPDSMPEKAKRLEYMKFFVALSRKLNFSNESLETANALLKQELTPEEALIVSHMLLSIRNNAERNNLDPILLVSNRKNSAETLEQLLTKAEDHRLESNRIDIYDCRMQLAKLFEQEARVQGADKLTLRQKEYKWRVHAKADPKHLLNKLTKEIAEKLPES